MASTIRKVLLDTLEDLTQEQLRKFCARLLDPEGEPRVRCSELENQDRVGVVEVLVRTFTAAGAGRVVVETLRDINHNELAEKLETSLETLRPATAQSTSQPTDACEFTLDPNTAHGQLSLGSKIKGHPGALDLYSLHLKAHPMDVEGCKRYRFGKDSAKRNRTIMVLGSTGAGKSTLVNGMINYILGVTWEDKFRFKLVDEGTAKSQAYSQTSEVTVYKLNHREGFQIDYSLTIVDTPGFGDTRGIKRDKMIVKQLGNLFSAKDGVSDIDAICVVAQASLARLTLSQKYVFDSVLSIFGTDVADNIRIMVTFADGQPPPVLTAINESGVPCPKRKDGLPIHFKFNNSALFADNKANNEDDDNEDDEDGGGNFDQMFWAMGTKSMKSFFTALNLIETKSLSLTKEVLRQRGQLENSIENIQKKVKLGLAKLEKIKQESHNMNGEFEYDFTYMKPIQKETGGKYTTNCQQCNTTCHYPCGTPNNKDKHKCWAMGSDGNCTQCTNKCHWSVHFNQKYRWGYEEVTEKRTYQDLKDKYQEATKKAMSVQVIMAQMKVEYDQLQEEVVRLMELSIKCLNRLKEIALKPNPLSTTEYINLLIEGEKSEARPGFLERIKELQHMREKAVTMGKVASGNKLL